MLIYNNYLIRYNGNKTKLVIPQGVKGIGDYAFTKYHSEQKTDVDVHNYHKGNDSIEEIVLPKSLVSIGNGAFVRCKKLKTITFNSGSKIEKTGYEAFSKSVIFNCKTKLSNVPIIVKSSLIDDSEPEKEFTVKYNKIKEAYGYEIKLTNGKKTIKYITKKNNFKAKIPKKLLKNKKRIYLTVRAFKYSKNKKEYSGKNKKLTCYLP